MLPSRASVVVVGGGPAGFMAAIAAAEAAGGRFPGGVLLLESTPEPLHKVLISGGGRCNVTHACWDPRALVDHYPRGGKALRGPFSRFATGDTVAWFQAHGLQLVQEPDGRLFPRSNRSSSVVDTLRRAAIAAGVELHTAQAGQAALALHGGGFRLRLRSGAELEAEHLVLATGSHPSGHRIAASLGHGLVAPVPSLFTLTLADHPLVDLAGVAMDPVQLELLLTPLPGIAASTATKPQRQRGPVLITHWGLSGPATLRLTAFAARVLRERRYRAELRVDWTGGRKPADLEGWFADARRNQARRQLANWRPWPDLSRRLWLHLLAQGGIDASLRWADLPRRSEQALVSALRDSRYAISGRGPFGEEFVTAGGIPLAEVNLATMESRLQPGLFLVGELLDVDGVTGGFNFQHCWSSGWLAGQALAAQRTCS
ncbi:NAD(P)/FAD-dependent oxidoreductase [Cyanobium sp. Cruz CV13-4-11]|jgi:predicted Rossmann fold flavoprotein|uniref:NAD(P)/FAD-dependent oxidoreductase n=1 Tax=unclassified Cyanobium TaxID=2627006 RepID=UPI0020CE87D7|nr:MULTISPECIES: NAD(P)/FAD-dependent oxidoreductase [unclassified Cyanobium]MCP9902032.1 NAD(P)/FAD-dependent oxidoreductase [Cyanobium sp. Cruz CV11-17]MCP9920890.1 NAD(P)/FAD-dependent oxidoreductase [Cyanobium sp. Cruz CV13-4-11]